MFNREYVLKIEININIFLAEPRYLAEKKIEIFFTPDVSNRYLPKTKTSISMRKPIIYFPFSIEFSTG